MRRAGVTASVSSARSRHASVVVAPRSPAILAAVALACEPTSSDPVVPPSIGAHIARCRVIRSHLEARRVLGVPYELSGLTVTCTDDAGVVREGEPVGK